MLRQPDEVGGNRGDGRDSHGGPSIRCRGRRSRLWIVEERGASGSGTLHGSLNSGSIWSFSRRTSGGHLVARICVKGPQMVAVQRR